MRKSDVLDEILQATEELHDQQESPECREVLMKVIEFIRQKHWEALQEEK